MTRSALPISRDMPAIKSRALLWLIALFVACFVAWAAIAEIDELVKGAGKVIPSKRLQLVQNLEGGIVSEILVSEGDFVEPGQVVMRLDDTQFDSSFRERQSKVQALQIKESRLRTELDGGSTLPLDARWSGSEAVALRTEEQALLERRNAQQENALKIIGQQIEQKNQALAQANVLQSQSREERQLAQKELDILNPLFEQGVVSEVEVLRAEKNMLKAKSDLARYTFQIPQVEAEISELRSKLDSEQLKYRRLVQEELNAVLAELAQVTQTRGALEDRLKRTQIRSPVKGTVKELWVNTIGGVVQPGMDILSIVPLEDRLLVEARIKPADIAHLYPGQKARVKLTAFDYALFGGLDAEVVHISADTLSQEGEESYYLVKVRTEKSVLGGGQKAMPIIPGMVAEVDILTGKKTILSYLLKPVLRARDKALTEP